MKAIVKPVLSSDSGCLKLWLARINYVLITNIGPCRNRYQASVNIFRPLKKSRPSCVPFAFSDG